MPFIKKCGHNFPAHANPADIAMKILTVKYPKDIEEDEKISKMLKVYHQDQDRQMAIPN